MQFERQTVIDNVSLLTPATIREVNELVVAAGHGVVRKKPGAPLHGRVDSFVVKTDVRHSTDVSLLWDAVRTVLGETVRLARRHGLSGCRQLCHWRLKLQRLFDSVRRKSAVGSRSAWCGRTCGVARSCWRACKRPVRGCPRTATPRSLMSACRKRPGCWIKSDGVVRYGSRRPQGELGQACSTARRVQMWWGS